MSSEVSGSLWWKPMVRDVTLDIDDTCDVAHGHQQLSLLNAHYDERANPSRAPTGMRQSLRSQRRRGNTGRTSCRRTPR